MGYIITNTCELLYSISVLYVLILVEYILKPQEEGI